MSESETPRQMSYRLIIGDYSTETKIAELNRLLDRLAAYEQGPDDAEVSEAEARIQKKCKCHYSSGDGALDYMCTPCADAPTDRKLLVRALRAERAKVAEFERVEKNRKEFEAACAFKCNHPFLPVGWEDGKWHCAECWATEEEARAESAESRLKAQGEALAAAEKALEVYARREPEGANDKKGWNWYVHVCDKFSGQASHFDWKGEEQDEPWEVAESALAKLRAAKEGA